MIELQKGQNLSLDKEAPGLKKITIGLGWDARASDGADFDLDASAFLLQADGKCKADGDFIFYGNLKHASESVIHTGDERTGASEGDDEQIMVDLSMIPADVQKVAIVVTIHDAEKNSQNFGQVQNASIRILNTDTQAEVTKYDLSEDYSTETSMIFGELYRHSGEWKFKAVGQGYASGGLKKFCEDFGLSV